MNLLKIVCTRIEDGIIKKNIIVSRTLFIQIFYEKTNEFFEYLMIFFN